MKLRVACLLTFVCACSSSSNPPGGQPKPEAGTGDAPPTADTWSNFAQGFFQTYCVECHHPGATMRDYTTITDVQRDAPIIRCGVAPTLLSGCTGSPAPGQFPISDMAGTNPKPDSATRLRLVAWLEAGLPQ